MRSTFCQKDENNEDWQHVEFERDWCDQQQAEQYCCGKATSALSQPASAGTMLNSNKEVITDVSLPERTPSRDELLSIVRKHSTLLGQSVFDEKDAGDAELDMRFWREMLDMFFIRGMSESRSRQDDDLIFFVRYMSLQHGHDLNDSLGDQPYFVRRWAPKLDKVIGENAREVDWRRSFYLNLIAHTSFSVTVAICSTEALECHQRVAGSPLTPIYKVTKTVYASPSRVHFQLDSKKAVETIPAYPDICFAVDDFDDTFDAVVLTEWNHCYCVILNAHGGAAFPIETFPQSCSSTAMRNFGEVGEYSSTAASKLTLFSGFVSYKMVREAYEAERPKFGGVLLAGSSTKSERLFMQGPGGRGEVEVAVSGVIDQSDQGTGPTSPVAISKGGFKMGVGTIMRKAAIAASVAAKQAYIAAGAGKRTDAEKLPLRCCLMSLSLPWESLAYDLLFKSLSKSDI